MLRSILLTYLEYYAVLLVYFYIHILKSTYDINHDFTRSVHFFINNPSYLEGCVYIFFIDFAFLRPNTQSKIAGSYRWFFKLEASYHFFDYGPDLFYINRFCGLYFSLFHITYIFLSFLILHSVLELMGDDNSIMIIKRSTGD